METRKIFNEHEFNKFIDNSVKCAIIIFLQDNLPSQKAINNLNMLNKSNKFNIRVGLLMTPNPLLHKKLKEFDIYAAPTLISFYKGFEFERYSGSLMDKMLEFFKRIQKKI